jgi:hypothetical protein
MADAAKEFFYLDEDGAKQDAELHNAIINPVDYPIDDKIMAPIRAKHRAKYLAAQSAKSRNLRWIRVKAGAQAQLKTFDESQHPRDDHGRWTDSGGGDDAPAAVPGYKPGVKGRGAVEVKARRDQWVAESPIKTLDHVIAAAPVAQAALGDAGRKIAADLGIEFKDPGPKTASAKGIERTKEKIAERNGLTARVTDTARGAFVLTSPDQADTVIRKLAQTHEVLAEPWRTIDGSHYTDRALLVRDRQTGLIGEVQITEPAMAAAKKVGHELYEQARSLPPHDPRIPALEAQMRAIYDKVLDGYKGTDWAAVDGRSRL